MYKYNEEDINVDISNVQSVKSMFEKVGEVDAIVSATGNAHLDHYKK